MITFTDFDDTLTQVLDSPPQSVADACRPTRLEQGRKEQAFWLRMSEAKRRLYPGDHLLNAMDFTELVRTASNLKPSHRGHKEQDMITPELIRQVQALGSLTAHQIGKVVGRTAFSVATIRRNLRAGKYDGMMKRESWEVD